METPKQVVAIISHGDPAVMQLLARLLIESFAEGRRDADVLLMLDRAGLYGSDVWVFWDGLCGGNTGTFYGLLVAVDLGALEAGELRSAVAACRRGDAGWTPEGEEVAREATQRALGVAQMMMRGGEPNVRPGA